MIKVSEQEAKISRRKKTISVKNVCIRNNQLVDTMTGDTEVLSQLAAEFPDKEAEFDFKVTFELGDDE